MLKLRTVIEVETDAIETHLLQEVQQRLMGPEFSSGQVVVFNGQPIDLGPVADAVEWRPDPPPAGRLGVVGAYNGAFAGQRRLYRVFFVDEAGETLSDDFTPNQLQLRKA